MYKKHARRRPFSVFTIVTQKHPEQRCFLPKGRSKADFVRKMPMFHVEQFGFGALFHVERKHAKPY